MGRWRKVKNNKGRVVERKRKKERKKERYAREEDKNEET
jgi:hypothetical protein